MAFNFLSFGKQGAPSVVCLKGYPIGEAAQTLDQFIMRPETVRVLRRVLIVHAVIVFYFDIGYILSLYGVYLPLSPSQNDANFPTLLTMTVIRIIVSIPIVLLSFMTRVRKQS